MCQCEDRPCCGHLAEERADFYYAELDPDLYYDHDRFYDDDPAPRDPEDCDHEDTNWDSLSGAQRCIYCESLVPDSSDPIRPSATFDEADISAGFTPSFD